MSIDRRGAQHAGAETNCTDVADYATNAQTITTTAERADGWGAI
jgi:hypothetical protein